MFRFLLSAVSISMILITSLLSPLSAEARRCDERMPLTLLSLYRTSEAIYVGRYEKNVEGEATETTEDYSVIPITKHFRITSALKGETRKLLTIEESEYRYKNAEMAAEMEEHGGGEDPEAAKPGDSVLLFVSKDAESGEVRLTEFTDGIKKMTPERLASYEARIKELKGILSTEKPRHSDLVAWMVRSAEDPHTRWEGTFELLQSYENLEWQEQRAKEEKEKQKQNGEEPSEYVPDPIREFETGDPGFARSLTEAQKKTLTRILANREVPKKAENSETAAVTAGDRELIELVKRWGDSRIASNLLGQLQADQSEAGVKSELMGSISSMLKDEELTGIFEQYSFIIWESDADEIREEEAPEPAAEASAEQPVESAAAEAEVKKKKTYGELRSELMAKFVARAEIVIVNEENKKVAKANR